MLKNLSEEIRECYHHAEDCARKAAAQTDPKGAVVFENLKILRYIFCPIRIWPPSSEP
jgi:hypothetical protein